MQEYLFRGRRTSDGEWVYGDLVASPENTHIVKHENGFFNSTNVIPNSIGQWTGLKDNNGRMIFEGDTLEILSDKNIDFVQTLWSLNDAFLMLMIMEAKIVEITDREHYEENLPMKW